MTTFELIEIFVCIIIIAVFYKISAFEYVTLQQCCFHITTTHAVVTFHFHVTVLLVFNTVAIACRGHTSCISITLFCTSSLYRFPSIHIHLHKIEHRFVGG